MGESSRDGGGATPAPEYGGQRLRDDLTRYYDQDAAGRAGKALDPERVRRRDIFIATLIGRGRARVLEVGLGPGMDASAFAAAGLSVAGVDLSPEHVRLAQDAGIESYVAPAQALPFADASFDALWCMSVLMHLPDDDLRMALTEFSRVLRPGATAAFGMWGGAGVEGTNPDDTIEPPRYFNWRTDIAIHAAVAGHAHVEQFDTWPVVGTGGREFRYQWIVARFGVRRDERAEQRRDDSTAGEPHE